jgi:hypothetical protein
MISTYHKEEIHLKVNKDGKKEPAAVCYVRTGGVDLKNKMLQLYLGARSRTVRWGTMLQAGWSRDRIPMRWIFFNLPNPSSGTMALGLTQLLTEMSTRNILGGKERLACKANLTAIYQPTVCGNLNISQSYGPPQPLTGIPLLLLTAIFAWVKETLKTVYEIIQKVTKCSYA